MRARGVLAVFAKAPEPGRVKTRMSPPFSTEQAAAFYAALLADVLDVSVRCAARLGLEPVLAVDPPRAAAELAACAPAAFRTVCQRGASLGERMEWAVRELSAGGAARVLLRGSDSPMLGCSHVGAALAALEHSDLAIAPDEDGGYSLIGLRAAVPGLFAHPMSTARVLEDTLDRARARGLRAALIEPSFDLDTARDLARLAAARAAGAGGRCPRTCAYLDAQGLWPAARAP